MERYDYYAAVNEDVKNYLLENDFNVSDYDGKDEAYEAMYDEMWIADSVTGNSSGSYTFNAWQAEENLCHNFDLLREACNEFCTDIQSIKHAEAADVTIRCFLLGQILFKVLDEYYNED